MIGGAGPDPAVPEWQQSGVIVMSTSDTACAPAALDENELN
jgi:hypothetical protein